MKCPECNNIVPDGSKFCNHCGHKFEQENTIKCPNPECGHSIPADSKFCPDCGTKISAKKKSDMKDEEDWKNYTPVRSNDLYGFKDIRTHKIVIPPQFEERGYFKEGVAVVKKNGKYGVIDSQCNLIIPFVYEKIGSFSEGMARVEGSNGYWYYGYINLKGEIVIPCTIRKNSSDYQTDFHDGLAKVYQDGKYGFIDKTGKIQIPCIYSEAGEFRNGYCLVNKGINNPKYGYIDTGGKEVIPCIYTNTDYYKKVKYGMVVLGMGYKYGVLDTSGRTLIPFESDYGCEVISENLIIVSKKDEHKRIYNKYVGFLPKTYYGLIEKQGNVILPCQYDKIYAPKESALRIVSNDKYGFINVEGNIITPCVYDDALDFENGYAIVAIKGKYGIINKEGEVIIPLKFQDVSSFSDGKAQVWVTDDVFGTIDTNGNFSINEPSFIQRWEHEWRIACREDDGCRRDLLRNEFIEYFIES